MTKQEKLFQLERELDSLDVFNEDHIQDILEIKAEIDAVEKDLVLLPRANSYE